MCSCTSPSLYYWIFLYSYIKPQQYYEARGGFGRKKNGERPAVFVEFTPIQWEPIKPGREYRAKPIVNLHIVTDWQGDASEGSELQDEALEVLDYSGIIHKALQGLEGEGFGRFDLAETHTNHNHEELVESIEVYKCVAERKL